MRLINSLKEYKDLIRWNKSRFPGINTNCSVMVSSFEKYILENRFYVEEHETGLAFLVDEGSYYNLYYYWNQNEDFADFRREKPVVVEILNVNGNKDVYLEQNRKKLEAAGFTKSRRNLQVAADLRCQRDMLKQEFAYRCRILEEIGLTLLQCETEASFAKAVALWDTHLEVTDIPRDHRTLCTEDRVLNIQNSDGEVAATIWWSKGSKTSESRHVVTHPQYYKKGLATTMLLAWILDTFEDATRWITWINENNDRSLRLYGKVGFKQNGRVSEQFILE